MRWTARCRPALILAVIAVLAAGTITACGGGNDADGGDDATAAPTATTTQTAVATTAVDTPVATETAEPTADGTSAMPAPFGLEGLDGLRCEGAWTNRTFGSTGDFAATFVVDDGGGHVELEIGGNAFGAEGGTVDAPFRQEDGTTVLDVDLAFLGQAMFRFDGDDPVEATLDAPPALGAGSEVTLTDFAFDGEMLTATVEITFADGGTAESALESTCS